MTTAGNLRYKSIINVNTYVGDSLSAALPAILKRMDEAGYSTLAIPAPSLKGEIGILLQDFFVESKSLRTIYLVNGGQNCNDFLNEIRSALKEEGFPIQSMISAHSLSKLSN